MGFTNSIHVQTRNIEGLLDRLKELKESDAFVGFSGENWIGIWSKACEDGGGERSPGLAEQVSAGTEDFVIAITNCDEDFGYWLYQKGKLVDQYPPPRFKLFGKKHQMLLDLCKDETTRTKVGGIFMPKRHLRPHEKLGISEEEFIEQAYRDMANMNHMSQEERREMSQKYGRLRGTQSQGLKVVCAALGITEWNWLYSDFTDDGNRPDIQVWEI